MYGGGPAEEKQGESSEHGRKGKRKKPAGNNSLTGHCKKYQTAVRSFIRR